METVGEETTVVLLTGLPGVGKTTLLREIVATYRGLAGGFYTEEVRQRGTRLGFDIVTLDGRRAPLARVGYGGRYRVSKYGVDVEALERVGVAALREALERDALIVVDEIGKMELFSEGFRKTIAEALEAGRRVLGTILYARHPWAGGLKGDPRVVVLEVTRQNRREVMRKALNWLGELEEDE